MSNICLSWDFFEMLSTYIARFEACNSATAPFPKFLLTTRSYLVTAMSDENLDMTKQN